MQQTASMGQAAQARKLSPAIAGLGAAAIASAITAMMAMGNAMPQLSSSDTAAFAPASQCHQIERRLMVSSNSGGGVVRLREGNYLSAPITLNATPQSVVFPLPRPEIDPVTEVLTIEGNANAVVISSDVTNFKRVLDVAGVSAFSVSWKPMKTC
jgi:hypothetical protein